MPGFPNNEQTYKGRYYGKPPIVDAMVRTLAEYYGRAMDWRSRGYRAPDQGDWTLSYRGYEPALQMFTGGLLSPSAANVRGGLNQLLPGTNGLPDEPGAAYAPATDTQSLLPGAPA